MMRASRHVEADMIRRPLAVIAFTLALLAGALSAQQPATQTPPPATRAAQNNPDRFEADIAKFEEMDRTTPPPAGSIVFTGSSSIRRWTMLPQDFPGLPVLNRGFGGSDYPDLVRYVDRLVVPVKPKMVVFYSGDNDVSRNRTAEQIEGDIRALAAKVHTALPETRVVFISIKPSIARWKYVDVMRDANARMKKFVAEDPRRIYVDVFTPMLTPDGQLRPELYVEDGLHLTRAGEAIWTAALQPILTPKT
jgi:lysophospholipase L1-like esterase